MAGTDEPSTYYRKGFGLKADVQGDLSADYNARIVDALREHEYTLSVEDVTIRLASEFGFCYGVERAVEYAYQTRRKFPDRRLLLVGEIIHNPHVNAKLRGMGIEILEPNADGVFDFSAVRAEDVVILPAFGVTIAAFEALRAVGCVLVDTTCGSVLNVWKRVEAYARDGVAGAEVPGRSLSRRARHVRGARGVRLRGRSRRSRRLPHEVRAGRVAGVRPGRAPAAHRRGEPDDDARARVARDR